MGKYILVILLGYFFGCLQWSYILTKLLRKQDIRSIGVGNAGASNMVISFGWKAGLVVALLDILKAIISILIIKFFFKLTHPSYLYLNGLGVILGHNYPFFMNFKGGKGTASTLGMMFGLDYRLGLIGVLLVVIVAFATDYIVLGTMTLVLFLLVATVFLKLGTIPIIVSTLIVAQSIYKHRLNIKKIIQGQETGLRSALGNKKNSKS
nr:glycerol-3-phosphate acyltransferase [Tissierella sp.]